jgi:hypothetical protein
LLTLVILNSKSVPDPFSGVKSSEYADRALKELKELKEVKGLQWLEDREFFLLVLEILIGPGVKALATAEPVPRQRRVRGMTIDDVTI